MSSITIACLDMAGTTVADDGSVMAAFTAALDRFGPAPGSAAHDEAMRIVHATMGQSKIEVFREILGDEATAQHANDVVRGHIRRGGRPPGGSPRCPGPPRRSPRCATRASRCACSPGSPRRPGTRSSTGSAGSR